MRRSPPLLPRSSDERELGSCIPLTYRVETTSASGFDGTCLCHLPMLLDGSAVLLSEGFQCRVTAALRLLLNARHRALMILNHSRTDAAQGDVCRRP